MTSFSWEYSDAIFKGQIDCKYKCSACKSSLKDPHQLRCGHRYCKACIDKLLQIKAGKRCPSCIEEDEGDEQVKVGAADKVDGGDNAFDPDGMLVPENVFADHATRREMSRLPVSCPSRMCTWTGLYKDLQPHLAAQCEYVEVPCSFVCGQKMQRNLLGVHTKTDCPRRPAKCTYCETTVKECDAKTHASQCNQRPMMCEGCHKEMAYELLADHLNPAIGSCSRQYTLCPYGCKDPLNRDNMEKHKERCLPVHLDAVHERIKQLEAKVGTNGSSVAEAVHDSRSGDRLDSGYQSLSGEKKEDRQCNLFAMPFDTSVTELQKHQQPTLSAVQKRDGVVSSPNIKLSVIEDLADAVDKALKLLMLEPCKCDALIETFTSQKSQESAYIQQMEAKVKSVERQVQLKEVRIAEQNARLDLLESVTYDGIMIWKMAEFSRKRREAVAGKTLSIFSHPFYTSPTGYKMCARIFLNGDGTGKGSHVSLFFVVMKGQHDALLKWPFAQKVSLTLIDQSSARSNISDSFRPDVASSSFKRPTSEMNVASGCPQFCLIKDLEDIGKGYVKDDTMFIKIAVDRTGLDV